MDFAHHFLFDGADGGSGGEGFGGKAAELESVFAKFSGD